MCMQYTVRRVPPAVDAALRRRARALNKSLNQTALEALEEALGQHRPPSPQRDLSDIAGTWPRDRGLEAALAAQDIVDEDLWR